MSLGHAYGLTAGCNVLCSAHALVSLPSMPPSSVQKYEHLYKKNEEAGSFYLQSKVYRAKERIEQDLQAEGVPTPDLTDIHTQQQQQQQGATGKDA